VGSPPRNEKPLLESGRALGTDMFSRRRRRLGKQDSETFRHGEMGAIHMSGTPDCALARYAGDARTGTANPSAFDDSGASTKLRYLLGPHSAAEPTTEYEHFMFFRIRQSVLHTSSAVTLVAAISTRQSSAKVGVAVTRQQGLPYKTAG
jgi:hypothetical protein